MRPPDRTALQSAVPVGAPFDLADPASDRAPSSAVLNLPSPAAEVDERPVGVAISVPYLPELESLRGIAMLLVLIFHLNGFVRFALIEIKGEAVSILNAFVRAGDNGVSLFFVLSAFLLSMPFIAAATGGKPVAVRKFAVRRALRILPLYLSSAVVGIALTTHSLADLWPKLQFLLFPDGFPPFRAPMPPFSNVWWSLHTEVQFYLMLPLLGPALATGRGRKIGAAALVLYLLALALYETRWFGVKTVFGDLTIASSLFGRGPLFLWGIAAAATYLHFGPRLRRRLARIRWLTLGGGDVLLAAVVAMMGLILQWRVAVGPNTTNYPPRHAYHLVEGALWALIVLMVLVMPLKLKSMIHNRVLKHFGVISYSMYMVHVPIILTGFTWLRAGGDKRFLGWQLESVVAAVVLCLATYGVSLLTYRYIESPFLRRKETI